jgi:hypothetical protein
LAVIFRQVKPQRKKEVRHENAKLAVFSGTYIGRFVFAAKEKLLLLLSLSLLEMKS